MPQNTLSFIHFGDTHIGPDDDFALWGKNTLDCGRACVDLINAFDAPVDFIVHTGDVVNTAVRDAYDRAAQLFSRLRYPVYFVHGNHDGGAAGFANLSAFHRDVRLFDVPDNTSYWFTVKNRAFLALDCRGPEFEDSQGMFSDTHEYILSRFLTDSAGMPAALFIHFPALPLDSRWIDGGMLLRNGIRLHELLLKSGRSIAGVFSGHVHHSVCVHMDGILYASCQSPFCRFRILPGDVHAVFEPDVPVGFNYVTMKESAVIIKAITVGCG